MTTTTLEHVVEGSVETPEFNLGTHNGYITVENPATGGHRTFKVTTAKSGPLEGKRIVSLLSGPDRDDYACWTGFGFVGEDGNVVLWKSYRELGKGAWAFYARSLSNPVHYAVTKGLRYWFAGRCRRCGRVLTRPDSIAAGIGPECAGQE
jgi:hypothetical protein